MTLLKCIILSFLFFNNAHSATTGQPKPWQFNFQEAASPMMKGIAEMHDFLLIIIAIIAVIVFSLLAYIAWRFRSSKNPIASTTTHHTMLEIVWTLIPLIIVIVIMIPSRKLILEMEKPHDPEMTVKAIGKQWYWTYEYPAKEGKALSFDSRMIETKDLKPNQLRLLDVDNQMVVPVGTTVQLIITGADVLHSFAVPSLGIKKDAVPGRINETWFRIDKEGVYYGQCSELCGANHGYMPIAIRVVSKTDYESWLAQMKHAH
ncbi:MAG: cytochrome c oxidase subunit II [Candidatus Paracaedibacteraceae bacterium]|nr:cytochrome c oxidase subunit II [Candidatus Paracaedibacteraceae bacterium]